MVVSMLLMVSTYCISVDLNIVYEMGVSIMSKADDSVGLC